MNLHGAYVTPNEHPFYFDLEAETFRQVSAFLGPPLRQDHDARIAPVLPFEESVDAVLEG